MEKSMVVDIDYQVWLLNYQIRDLILKVRGKELRRYDLSVEEVGVLMVLTAMDVMGQRATPAEISRWLLREHHSILGILSRMVKKGLIEKNKGVTQKNVIVVTLTEKGRIAYHTSTKRKSIHQVMSHLSDSEKQELSLILRKLRRTTLNMLGIEKEPPLPELPRD